MDSRSGSQIKNEYQFLTETIGVRGYDIDGKKIILHGQRSDVTMKLDEFVKLATQIANSGEVTARQKETLGTLLAPIEARISSGGGNQKTVAALGKAIISLRGQKGTEPTAPLPDGPVGALIGIGRITQTREAQKSGLAVIGSLFKSDPTAKQVKEIIDQIDRDSGGEWVRQVVEQHAQTTEQARAFYEEVQFALESYTGSPRGTDRTQKIASMKEDCQIAIANLEKRQGLVRGYMEQIGQQLTRLDSRGDLVRRVQVELSAAARKVVTRQDYLAFERVARNLDVLIAGTEGLKTDEQARRLQELGERLHQLLPEHAKQVMDLLRPEVERSKEVRTGMNTQATAAFLGRRADIMMEALNAGDVLHRSTDLRESNALQDRVRKDFTDLGEAGRFQGELIDHHRDVVRRLTASPEAMKELADVRRRQQAPSKSAMPRPDSWFRQVDQAIDGFIAHVGEVVSRQASPLGSLTGDVREILTEDDYNGLLALRDAGLRTFNNFGFDNLGQYLSGAQRIVERVRGPAREVLSNVSRALQELPATDIQALAAAATQGELSQEDLAVIVEAKAALFDIQQKVTTAASIGLLIHGHDVLPKHEQQRLQNLVDLAAINSPAIDDAVLDHIIAQHRRLSDEARMTVAVEGAGPIGLLSSFLHFREGADVRLFEKRSAEYTRGQILRIDPRWMDSLSFLLGTGFDAQFGERGQGRIRERGYGQLLTRNLEQAMHLRLTQMLSRLEMAEGEKQDSMIRLAAHEVDGVLSPEQPGGRFRVHVKYNERYDAASKAAEGQAPKGPETYEVDMVVAAGGVNSTLGRQYFPDTVPETESLGYGVASWTRQDEGQGMKGLFADHVRAVTLGEKFHRNFALKLQEINHQHPKVKIPKFINRQRVSDGERKTSDKDNVYSDAGAKHKTRLFDNRDTVYMGMQIPDVLQDVLDRVRVPRDQKGQVSPEELNAVKRDVVLAWFQALADEYGLNKEGISYETDPSKHLKQGLHPGMMERGFVSYFQVAQSRVARNLATMRSQEREVVIAPSGDLKAPPHFFSGSGITSGRVSVEQNVELMREMRKGRSLQELQQDFEARSNALSDYVIGRGRPFLQPKSEAELQQARRNAVDKQLRELAEDPSVEGLSINNNTMVARYRGKDYSVTVVDGTAVHLRNANEILAFPNIYAVLRNADPEPFLSRDPRARLFLVKYAQKLGPKAAKQLDQALSNTDSPQQNAQLQALNSLDGFDGEGTPGYGARYPGISPQERLDRMLESFKRGDQELYQALKRVFAALIKK